MNEPDDLDIARRLQAHYRETATAGVPVTLVSEVRDMFSSVDGHRRLRTGRLAAVIAAVFVVLLGTAFTLGRPGIDPSSSGSTAQSSTPVGSKDPGGPTSASASPVAPSPSMGERTDQVTVLRGAAIGSAVAAATDDSPFLIGGQILYTIADCAVPAYFPETPLLRFCDDRVIIRDDDFQAPLMADNEPTGFNYSGDVVVVRVHTRDPRSADCRPAYRERCERALHVEQFLWTSGANESDTIPATFSILPPQVNPGHCDELGFGYVRCAAIVERARSMIGIGWLDIRSVTVAHPTGGQDSAGSDSIADVVVQAIDGTDHEAQVRCLSLRSASLVCGPSSIEWIPPSP